MNIQAQAGRDVIFQSITQHVSPASSVADGEGVETAQRSFHAVNASSARLNAALDEGRAKRALTAVESSLSREIDNYRDLMTTGFPSRASQSLKKLLDNLPDGATPTSGFG